jgi:molecular chaperone Hsp33
MADELVRTLIRGRAARVVIAVTTELAREAARRHFASPDAAVAMARAGSAALLAATLTKGDERVTLQVMGGGPLGQVIADAQGAGEVRMFVRTPAATIPGAILLGPRTAVLRPSVAAAVGVRGSLSLIRDLGLKERYQGQSPLVSGEIDVDVEDYLDRSEQVPSALACEVALGADGGVEASVGILVQLLPGQGGVEAAGLIADCRARLRKGALFVACAAGETDPAELAHAALGADEPIEALDRRPVRFFCPCTAERAASSLALLALAELDEMIVRGQPAEVHCDFCRARYEVPAARLRAIRAEAAARPRA